MTQQRQPGASVTGQSAACFFSLSSLLLCRAPAPDLALLFPTPISHGAQLGLPLLLVPLARS
jgi:hypothetical protein